MVKANELRIGNWVLSNGVEIQIALDNIKWHPTMIPIPLTPEILEKCGFTLENDNISKYWKLVINRTEVISIEDDGSVGLNAENESSKQGYATYPDICKYLHQLQNLIFSLTGKELQYTP